jgi:glutamine amidotransferase-like uncharacterized protein
MGVFMLPVSYTQRYSAHSVGEPCMKYSKRFKIVLVVFVLVTNLVAVNAHAKRVISCPINSTTDFVYYSGSGASSLSQSWMVHFLDWWKAQDQRIEYMNLSAKQIAACDLASYSDLDMYIQPGGNAYLAQRWIGSSGKSRINTFLNSGGSYFGACAGWYFAAGDYVWQDSYYDHANLLGAYPVTVEGSIREIADYDNGPGYAITQLDNGHTALYWGGPTIGYEYTDTVAGVVDSYLQYRNLPAVVRYGNMLLTSVHLEAYENDGFTGLSTTDREANYRYLARAINEVAGTDFDVPGDPEPPLLKACADDTDNDGDGLIDYPEDPGCTSTSDDDETDTSLPPGEAFFDTFEEGFNWNVYGAGRPWGIKTDKVLDGSYSAGVKKTTAGNLSYMEHEVDLSAYSVARFEYSRKLVGLDAADDFSAEYFDGAWIAVEALGRGRENGGFVTRSFDIPATTTAIRFMCEAGAVSEGCWVDNVKIIAD